MKDDLKINCQIYLTQSNMRPSNYPKIRIRKKFF